MTDSSRQGRCLLCAGEITDVHVVGHWSEVGGAEGFWLAGKCVPCGVDFQKAVGKTNSYEWRMSCAERDWLIEQLTQEEIARLTTKFSRYEVLGAKWREFLAKKRENDEIWRFADHTRDGETAITIVRNGIPIADYRTLGDLTIVRGI